MDKEFLKDKEICEKELEQASGGIDPSFFTKIAELKCLIRNLGTDACTLNQKGQLQQCTNCSRNHN